MAQNIRKNLHNIGEGAIAGDQVVFRTMLLISLLILFSRNLMAGNYWIYRRNEAIRKGTLNNPLRSKIRKKLSVLQVELEQLDEQYLMLKKHSFEYQNSLGTIGREELNKVNSILYQVRGALREAEEHLAAGTLRDL